MSTPPQIDRESDVRENQSEPINVLAGASQIESDLPVGAPYIGDRDGHGAADGVEVGLHVRQHKCRSLITIKITTLVMINKLRPHTGQKIQCGEPSHASKNTLNASNPYINMYVPTKTKSPIGRYVPQQLRQAGMYTTCFFNISPHRLNLKDEVVETYG